MRVLCENCGTTYKIPDSKLVREVNRATCRKCGHMMVIRMTPSAPAPRAGQHQAPGESEEERTLVTSLADVERRAKEQAAAMEAQTARVDPVEGAEVTDVHEHTDAPAASGAGGTAVPEEDLSEDLAADTDIENDLPTAEEPTQAPEELAPVIVAPAPAPPAPSAAPNLAGRAARPAPAVPAAPAAAPARPRTSPPVKEPGTTTQPTLYGVPTPVNESVQLAEGSKQRQRHHDPSGDLTLVLMGSLLAIGGALILAFNARGDAGIRFLGLLITLFGGFASFLVVATSNRGRKAASVVISLFLSVMGAVLTAGIAFVVVPSGDGPSLLTTLTQGLRVPTVATAPVAPPEPPAKEPTTTAPTTPEPTPPATAATEPAPVDPAVEALLSAASTTAPTTAPATAPATPPATTAPTTPAPAATTTNPTPAVASATTKPATTTTTTTTATAKTTTPTTTASTSKPATTTTASTTTTKPATTTASTSKPATTTTTSTTTTKPATTASTSSTKTGLQPSVVDTMVRTNSGVKRCFAEEKSRSGALPARVDVKITVVPTGKVNTAAIKGGDLAGSALDSCLSSAIKGITFPPFEGEAVSLTYPFIFN